MALRSKPAPSGVYDLRYAEAVVEFMGRGYSLTAFAGEIGASRAILDRWTQDHPTFARAVERGQARRARVLEDRLLAGKSGAAFGLHMEALRTAAPQDWRREGGGGDARAKPRPPPTAQLDLPDNGRNG